jgi:transcriptional regulator with XRE-family HTH domain
MADRRPEPETFGTVLRRMRQAKNLTQRDVARAIEMDFSYFSRLETDRFKSLPTRETIENISRAMQCNDDETAELLAAAGRVALEMQERPALRRLYRTAMQLDAAALEELVRQAEERLKQRQTAQGQKGERRDGLSDA